MCYSEKRTKEMTRDPDYTGRSILKHKLRLFFLKPCYLITQMITVVTQNHCCSSSPLKCFCHKILMLEAMSRAKTHTRVFHELDKIGKIGTKDCLTCQRKVQ